MNRKFTKLLVIVFALVMFASFFVACTGTSNDREIKLGVIAPLSGAGTSYGIGIRQGAEMAIDEINAAGGINGRKIKMAIADDATNPAESVTAIKRLIDHDKVDVIVGGWGSSQVLACQPVAEKEKVPYIIVGATNPKITTVNNYWTFAVIKSDAIQAEEIANAAVNKMKFATIAVIYDTNDYGTGNKDVFVNTLKTMGKAPVTIESYKSDDKDFTAQLSKIKQLKPDAIAVFGTIPAAPAIMIQARNLGLHGQFIGTGGLANQQLIGLGGKAAEGTVLTTYFHEDTNSTSKEWAAKIREKFAGATPAADPILSAWEYRAIKQILAPSISKARTKNDDLRAAIKAFRGVVIGFDEPVYFNEKNQLVQPTVLIQVRDSKFQMYK